MKTTVVEESQFGLYVWAMPDGTWIGDDEGNYLCVAAQKGDRNKIAALKNVAHNYLRDMQMELVGGPVFLSGRRMLTDEEYEEQQMRARAGLVPDKYDVAAMKEQARYAKRND